MNDPPNETPPAPAETPPDAAIRALAGATPARVWRIVALVQFALIVLVGGGVALLAELEVGPFAPAPAAGTEQQKEWWTCPMHPQIHQDHPGTCPICGMTLVPEKPAATKPAAPSGPRAMPGMAPVTVPLTILQQSGVRLARATTRPVGDAVETVGSVAADETRVVHVHSRVDGWITGLKVDQTGQYVAQGDTLLDLFSRDVLQAEQEFVAVGGRGHTGAGTIGGPVGSFADAARQRLLVFDVPPDVIDEIARTGRPQALVPVRSPASGYVIVKNVLEGMYVTPGMDMFTIADLSDVWVWADVYEVDLTHVQLDDRVEVRTLAFGDRVFPGKVTFFDPTVNQQTRTLRVRIEIPNRDLTLRPGMWASVRIVGPERQATTVPYDAVVDTGRATYVFVQTAPGEFTAQPVVAGRTVDDATEIRSGLKPGDVVVASGTFLIDSESRIHGSSSSSTTTPTSDAGQGGMANMPGM